MPIVALVLLLKYIKSTDGSKTKQFFLIIYQGLKPDKFYWEFVNTLRKVIILASLLLPTAIKIILSSTLLIVTGRIQLALKPYKDEENNNIELLAITSGIVTILSNLVYDEDTRIGYVVTLILLFTIFLNILFFLHWFYMLLQMYTDKYKIAQIIFKVLSCIL
mmetsp:Transcript_7824/g.6920  ORF Transcript_7824/g.6920 Transcript_7824/m.6920 type:complete len:163 (-) Transcript_7824:351-839(-)